MSLLPHPSAHSLSFINRLIYDSRQLEWRPTFEYQVIWNLVWGQPDNLWLNLRLTLVKPPSVLFLNWYSFWDHLVAKWWTDKNTECVKVIIAFTKKIQNGWWWWARYLQKLPLSCNPIKIHVTYLPMLSASKQAPHQSVTNIRIYSNICIARLFRRPSAAKT